MMRALVRRLPVRAPCGALMLWLATLSGAAFPGGARAQVAPAASAAVAGQVLTADGGEPIRFSLVVLLRSDSTRLPVAILTDFTGRFLFRNVAAGEYRLRIDRIGYEAEPLPPFRVHPGDALDLVLRSDPRPVRLAAITVASQPCYTEAELDEEPALATLWREARKAGEARRLFDGSYSYQVDVSEQVARLPQRSRAWERHRTAASTPALAAVLADSGAQAGYALVHDGALRLVAPELPELLGPGFLRNYCLGLLPDRDRGKEHRILFRPVASPDSARIDLDGTIVLDAAFNVKRLEFRYRAGAEPFARGSVEYGNVKVLGSELRFARKLEVETQPGAKSAPMRVGAQRGRATMLRYRDFVRDTSSSRP